MVSNNFKDFTVEEYAFFVKNISNPKFEQEREFLRNEVKRKYISKMRRKSHNLLLKLEDINIKHNESINLLQQSYNTLKNCNEFVRKKYFVDANTLLRSAFENVIMAMMIDSDENVFIEFTNLSINNVTRKFTKPAYLRKRFRDIFISLDEELLGDIDKITLCELFDDFYSKLCHYTHSTLYVSYIVEFQKQESIDVLLTIFKLNVYFLETVLYLCLKKLANDKKKYIDISYLLIGWYILAYDISSLNLDMKVIEQYRKFLYVDINEKYLKNETEKVNNLLK